MARGAAKGWYHLENSRKFHYIDSGQNTTLCGRFLVFVVDEDDLEDTHHDHPDNCAACQRERAKRYPEETAHGG